jgi:hypothetical protein
MHPWTPDIVVWFACITPRPELATTWHRGRRPLRSHPDDRAVPAPAAGPPELAPYKMRRVGGKYWAGASGAVAVESPGPEEHRQSTLARSCGGRKILKTTVRPLISSRFGSARDQRRSPNGCLAVQVAGNSREGDLDAFTSLQLDPRCDGPGCRATRKAAAAADLQRHAAIDHGIPRGNAASSAGGSGTLAASDASRDRTTVSR